MHIHTYTQHGARMRHDNGVAPAYRRIPVAALNAKRDVQI